MKMIMRKKLLSLLASSIFIILFISASTEKFAPHHSQIISAEKFKDTSFPVDAESDVYNVLRLKEAGLSRTAFDYAVKGLNYLYSNGRLKNNDIVSIVDFSQASSKKRFYVIDIKNKKLLFNTYVSHGRNSGREMATFFSNAPESNKSSLGFYATGSTYMGKHGYSMRLLGEEKGINDNANDRAIVMHSAAYVSESAIKAQGFIGRSLGCPALPENCYKPIIDKIKNGTCLFLYSPDGTYAVHSPIIKQVA